jgi:16S rRNA (cytidine1402-2'-O)-methyltransferase
MTRKLMGLFGIQGRVERCDETATEIGTKRAIDVLAQGGVVAFCSDAGTPGISDPGERLTRGVIKAGFGVFAIPGASAVLSGLIVSGLPTGQFFFAGFAPTKSGARQNFFQDLVTTKATMIFYETGPRLATSLADMAVVFGNREACIARELTKLYEETRRGTLNDLLEHFRRVGAPKGEIVVVVAGAPLQDDRVDDESLDAALHKALEAASVKDAAAFVATQLGLPRKEVYARALFLTHKHNT